ncbi:MAG TPA: ester cyclase [Thermoplasmata archaeon]|nr:ester cyclase [Thermoplasmata archaeon]
MAKSSSVDVVRSMEAAYNRNDQGGFLDRLSESVEGHDPSVPEPLRGRAAVGAWFAKARTIFPDLRMEPVRTTAEGERVAVEYIETGTQKGPIPGPAGHPIGPTNRSFRHQLCIVYRVEREKIVEFRLCWDVLGVMAQLGLGG